jgi:hypothetical protein
MTRIERENMMEFSGMGVPRFVTCCACVSRDHLNVDSR